MKALVVPQQGNLVAQIEAVEFPVADPFFWVDCPEFVIPGYRYVDGQFIAPDPEPVPQVTAVSMRQARLALLQQGLLSNVDSVLSQLPSPQKEAAQIEWEYATEVQRNSQLVDTLSQSLGLTEVEIENLFNLAVTL